jgi:hypothetical protein
MSRKSFVAGDFHQKIAYRTHVCLEETHQNSRFRRVAQKKQAVFQDYGPFFE